MKLEELARQSSVAARTSVARLEPPPVRGESTARRFVAPMALAGVLALVAGGLYVLARPGDLESIPAAELPGEVVLPHLALPDDAAPWQLAFAGDLGEVSGSGLDGPTLEYYGTIGADDPFADGDLVVVTLGVLPDDQSSEVPGDPVDVRSTQGAVMEDSGLPGSATAIGWVEDDGAGNRLEVMLASRSRGVDELVAVADGASIDVAAGSVVLDPTLGLDLVETASGTPFNAVSTDGRTGSVVNYHDGGGGNVVITTSAGRLATSTTALRWWAGSVEPVTVAGRDGVLADLPALEPAGQRLVVVTWERESGVVASVTYSGSDDSLDVVALANTVVAVDDTVWEELVEATGGLDDASASMDEVYGEGGGELDGLEYTWAVGLQGESLCLDVVTTSGGMGTCGESQPVALEPAVARTLQNMFGDEVGAVLIAADPGVSDIVEPTGSWSVSEVATDELTYFVAIGPADVQPRFDVVVDGAVVTTLEAAAEGAEDVTGTVLGDGGGELDGISYGWTLSERFGDLCLDLTIQEAEVGSGTSACEPLASELLTPASPPRPVLSSAQESLRIAMVVTGPEVDEVRDPDGRAVVTEVEHGDRTYFVVVSPTEGSTTLEAVSGGQVTPVAPDPTATP